METQNEQNIAAPKLSVVLATHRLDSYFPAAISSVLQQTFQEFEFLIVLERGLRDRRDALMREYASDGRVRWFEAPALGGLGLALNLGIAEARGEYIARMDGDDVSMPDRFEKQVAFLDAHPNVAALGGRVQLIDENDQPLPSDYPYYGTDAEIRRILPLRNPMPHPAMMMRKEVLFSLGGYRYGHSAEDYELFLRMSRNRDWHFANLDSVVLQYRRHGAQVTNPEYFKARFADTAGFLLTETIRQRSPRYLAGMVTSHHWTRHLRQLLRRSASR